MSPQINHWQNKVCLVTGGSSGIGLATARALAAQGAHVWIVARHPEKLDEALEQIRAQGGASQRHGAFAADVAVAAQAAEAVAWVSREAGVPDVLVNSAGVAHPGYVEALELDIFRWMMDVNYFGTVYTTKAVLEGMLARGSGHIINISSGASWVGVFGYGAYSPSKFAVNGFSGVLRSELKRRGLRVSLAFPPDTDTPQLAYENQFKPPETKILAGNVKAMSAAAVAEVLLHQAAQGKFLILPNFDTWLLYTLSRWMGGSFYALMDWLVARGLAHAAREQKN